MSLLSQRPFMSGFSPPAHPPLIPEPVVAWIIGVGLVAVWR
jgi:hypothetical protein